MNKWDELRTIYYVAVSGTLSGAADALGIHRATVSRHIDSVEKDLDAKVFHRGTDGYELTEVGKDIFRVTKITAEQFDQVFKKIKMTSSEVSGELIVTSTELVSPFVIKALSHFTASNPDIRIKYKACEDLLNLEYGEAHIAIRIGSPPSEEDNHVQRFIDVSTTLYAHKNYVEKFGSPKCSEDYRNHLFILPEGCEADTPFVNWLLPLIDQENVVFSSSGPNLNIMAVEQGIGIGFMPAHLAQKNSNLVEILPAKKDWIIPSWLVVHRDQFTMAKVQEFLKVLYTSPLE